MKDLDIRYTIMKDFSHLIKWLKEPENNKWFPFSTKKEIESSAKNWISFSKYRASLTGTINNEVVAIGTLFLMPYKKLAHEAMFYLIIDEKHRRKGVGQDMLKNLMNLAQSYFKLETIYAEVFDGCPIIGLLEKMNFEKTATQEKCVKEGPNKYLDRLLFEIWFK